MGLGSGENGEFTFLDNIAIVSFFIGLLNLEENLTQSDKQELEDVVNRRIDQIIQEVHSHLKAQDEKLDIILERLEDNNL